jgi:hypothetical protein
MISIFLSFLRSAALLVFPHAPAVMPLCDDDMIGSERLDECTGLDWELDWLAPPVGIAPITIVVGNDAISERGGAIGRAVPTGMGTTLVLT